MVEVFRIPARLPVGAMKTYALKQPAATHFRRATCAEVDCDLHLNGWKTEIDESTELGQSQAYYIRNSSGRRYVEDRNIRPGMTVFTFEAGQTCFGSIRHQVSLERPPLYVVRGGDWRGNPDGSVRTHANGDDWVDDFANHQQNLADQIEQG